MRTVSLYVAGAMAVNDFVVDVLIPPFDPMPDVLIWGARIFRRMDDARYIEAFAFWVPMHEGH